jgi:hypothetical protein
VPPACSIFEFHDDRLWMAGNLTFENRIWVSKKAVADELMPEGMSDLDFLSVPGRVGREAKSRITAMHTHRDNVVAHTPAALTVIDPDANFRRTVRPALTGAINQACVTQTINGKSLFLGADLNLYDVDAILGQSAGELEISVRAATRTECMGYIRNHVDIADAGKNPHLPALFTDTVNGLIWIACNQGVYQPTTVPPGAPTLFCWDGVTRNLSGPFYAPTVHSGTFREPMEGKLIFQHMNATMCAWTLGNNHTVNYLETSAAFNYGSVPVDPVVRPKQPTFPGGRMNITGLTGYAGARIEKGHVMALGTQWMEFGAFQTRKSVLYLDMTFVRNSRCHLWVEFYIDDHAVPLTRVLGQMYFDTRQDIRIPVALSGFRIRVVMYMGIGEDKPCVLRSAKLGYELMGPVV